MINHAENYEIFHKISKLSTEKLLPENTCNEVLFNPNKAGLFEGNFFLGVQFNLPPPLHISKKTYPISI